MYERREELLVVLFFAFIAWAGFMLYSLDAYGQNKFFSTPNRGGVEGAKGQAILNMLMNENAARKRETAANAASITALGNSTDASITALKDATDASLTTISNCGTQGMIFGPGHALADGSDCVPSFQIASDGNVLFQAGAKFGTYELCDPTTAGTIRYNASAKRMEFCNGDVWGMLGGNAGCSINFPAVSNADPDTFYDTTDAVYSGTTTTASVAGATAATIRRNGGNTGMSSGVTVNQGNSVGIHGKSASQFNQTANFTLDIGAYTACWQVTTKQQDVTPNSFSFTNLTNQPRSAQITSNVVTVSGFDGPLMATVGGQGSPKLKIGGGSWTASGNINPGQSIQVKLTTDPNFDTEYTATVTLGTYSTLWKVKTELDGFPAGTFIRSGGHYNQGCPPNLSSCGQTLPIQQGDRDVCASRNATYRQVREGENGCGGPDWGHCEIICQ